MDEKAIEAVQSIAGIESLAALFSDGEEKEKVKKALLFSLKTIPASSGFLALVSKIQQREDDFLTSNAREFAYTYASALLALNVTDNPSLTTSEKRKLFTLLYVILKRFLWFLTQHKETSIPQLTYTQLYFAKSSTQALIDIIHAIYLS